MATQLVKNVRRALPSTRYIHKGKLKRVDVTLTPNETLLFHITGTRRYLEIELAHCLNLAEIMNMDRMYRNAMEKYKAGELKRKPRRGQYPYSQVYFKAIETTKL
jgi:hypothetical protein